MAMCPNAAAENVLSRWDKAVFDSIYDAPPRREPLWTLMEGITEFGHYRAVMGVSMLLMAYGNEEHRGDRAAVDFGVLGNRNDDLRDETPSRTKAAAR